MEWHNYPRTAVRKLVTEIGPRVDGVIPAWRSVLTRGLTVFIFHEITSTPSAFQMTLNVYTSAELFRRQLAWIGRRFTVVDPPRLRQLGGDGELPPNAALITFDDAWAGVFRVGLPILREYRMPALCFLNMGTVDGAPDLAAVWAYERTTPRLGGSATQRRLDAQAGSRIVIELTEKYAGDGAFRAYQGPTATPIDLAVAADSGHVWFGSHLYNHWDVRAISVELYEQSFTQNRDALSTYPNNLAAFATPHGYAGGQEADPFSVPAEHGARVIFTGIGNQNRVIDSLVLDRVSLPPESASGREWWYATHRRRALGQRTS